MPYALIVPPGLSVSVPDAPWPFAYPYAMTLEFWIKPAGGNGTLLYSASMGGGSTLTLNPDGSLNAQHGGSGVWSTGPVYLFDGNWHHLAIASPDGNNWSVYLNGSPVPVSGSGPMHFLGPSYGADPFLVSLAGYVAEFRLWNVQRAQADIAANMGLQISPPQAGLVGLWNFDNQNANDATGTFSTDSGGSGGFQSTDVPVFASGLGDIKKTKQKARIMSVRKKKVRAAKTRAVSARSRSRVKAKAKPHGKKPPAKKSPPKKPPHQKSRRKRKSS